MAVSLREGTLEMSSPEHLKLTPPEFRARSIPRSKQPFPKQLVEQHFLPVSSRPNRSLPEQAAPEKSSEGSRMAGGCCLSGSLRCILSKRHLEDCAYPNPSACKSKAHKHLFKAALTYRVFKLFTAAACETQQNVQSFFVLFFFFPKILFPSASHGI